MQIILSAVHYLYCIFINVIGGDNFCKLSFYRPIIIFLLWLLTTACIGGIEGWKIVQLGSLSLMPALSSWQTIIVLIFLARHFRTIKKRSFTRHTVNEATFCGLRRSKALWKFPCCLWQTLSRRPAIIRFVILTQNAIRRLWGERNLWKTIAFQNDVLSEEKKLTLINCSRWSYLYSKF